MFRSPQTKGSALAGESNFFATLSRPFRRSEWGLLLAILAVVVLTAVLDDRHSYWNELKALLAGGSQPWYERIPSAINIVRQTAYLGIFALGAAIVIIAGGIDLSSGSMIAFSGSMCATIMVLLAPDEMKFARPVGLTTIALAIAGTLVLALLVGSLHAWLITVVGLPPFIATLATLVGLRSLARAVVENVTAATWGGKSTQINMFDMQFRYLATSVWIPVVLFCLLATATWLLLSRTVVGRDVYEGMIVGGVVVIAVALTQLRTAGRQGKRFFGGALGVVTIVNLTLVTGNIAALMGQQTKHGATRIGSIAASIAFILLILIKLVETRRGRALGKP